MEKWLEWAREIQALSQAGLAYTGNEFDRERYTRLREISAEIVSTYTDIPLDKVKDLFCGEEGYQTPKIDTRAVILRDEQILLVRETSGLWVLPGGWADIGLTLRENVEKETKEEAGLDVRARRVLAIHDHAMRNHPALPWSIWKIFVACDVLGGHFEENIETTASDYFSLDNLPELAEGKTTRAQIEQCVEALESGAPITFD